MQGWQGGSQWREIVLRTGKPRTHDIHLRLQGLDLPGIRGKDDTDDGLLHRGTLPAVFSVTIPGYCVCVKKILPSPVAGEAKDDGPLMCHGCRASGPGETDGRIPA